MIRFTIFIKEHFQDVLDRSEKLAQAINTHILTDAHLSDAHEKFLVFRLQSRKNLDNANAGDILGLAKFSSSDNAEVSATGTSIGVYEVTNSHPGHFGNYIRFRGGHSDVSESRIGREQQPINWNIKAHHVNWYSFPEGGQWSAKLVHEISPSKIQEKCHELGFSYWGEDELQDVIVAYSLVFNKKILV